MRNNLVIHIIYFTFLLLQGVNAQHADSVSYFNYSKDTLNYFNNYNSGKAPRLIPLPLTRQKSNDSTDKEQNTINWSKELESIILKKIEKPQQNEDDLIRVENYQKYENKIITKITLRQLDVFGPSVSDTNIATRHWLQNVGNKLHFQSNKSIIENNLLFRINDKIDPLVIDDNERLLRSIPNIQDARIYIVDNPVNPGTAEIIVVTKDVWPIGGSIDLQNINRGQASFWNQNVIGLGQSFKITGFYDNTKEQIWGHRLYYRIPNIYKTFTNLEIINLNKWNNYTTSINVSRQVNVPVILTGGGFHFQRTNEIIDIQTFDSTLWQRNLKYDLSELWITYALPQKKLRLSTFRKSIFFSGQFNYQDYWSRPKEVTDEYLTNFHDKKSVYFATGILWKDYQKTRYLYGFGNTEDMPFGFLIKATGGYEKGEFYDRNYIGLKLHWSNYYPKYGFFEGSVNSGRYFNTKLNQSAYMFDFKYISPLFGTINHKFRNFVQINYSREINAFNDEFVSLRGYDNEVRGIISDEVKGHKRLFGSSELVYYSPYEVLGFKIVGFLFYDGAFIDYNTYKLLSNPLISSLGLGVRIRNERLVVNTIRLRIALYPNSDRLNEYQRSNIEINGIDRVLMPDFSSRKPDVIYLKN